MIITSKERQQELSTSSTNHLQSGILTQWCQNTFSFSLKQSYYFIMENVGEKSAFKAMEKLQICKKTEVAGQRWTSLGTKSWWQGLFDRERTTGLSQRLDPRQRKSRTRQCNLNDFNWRQIVILPMKWKTSYAPINCPFSTPWQGIGSEQKKSCSYFFNKSQLKITWVWALW